MCRVKFIALSDYIRKSKTGKQEASHLFKKIKSPQKSGEKIIKMRFINKSHKKTQNKTQYRELKNKQTTAIFLTSQKQTLR